MGVATSIIILSQIIFVFLASSCASGISNLITTIYTKSFFGKWSKTAKMYDWKPTSGFLLLLKIHGFHLNLYLQVVKFFMTTRTYANYGLENNFNIWFFMHPLIQSVMKPKAEIKWNHWFGACMWSKKGQFSGEHFDKLKYYHVLATRGIPTTNESFQLRHWM